MLYFHQESIDKYYLFLNYLSEEKIFLLIELLKSVLYSYCQNYTDLLTLIT
jgi:hypothetical protein